MRVVRLAQAAFFLLYVGRISVYLHNQYGCQIPRVLVDAEQIHVIESICSVNVKC